jgi:hypothetical protein
MICSDTLEQREKAQLLGPETLALAAMALVLMAAASRSFSARLQ